MANLTALCSTCAAASACNSIQAPGVSSAETSQWCAADSHVCSWRHCQQPGTCWSAVVAGTALRQVCTHCLRACNVAESHYCWIDGPLFFMPGSASGAAEHLAMQDGCLHHELCRGQLWICLSPTSWSGHLWGTMPLPCSYTPAILLQRGHQCMCACLLAPSDLHSITVLDMPL